MCDDLSKEISTDGLYLASPSFFSRDKTRLPPDTTCTCTLTTTGSFAAQALYLSLHEEDWNMTCDSCGISFVYMWTILPSMKICSKIEPKVRVTVYELTFGHYIGTRKARPLSMNRGSASKVCHFLSSFPFDNRNKDNSLWIYCFWLLDSRNKDNSWWIYCFWLLKTNGMFSNEWH